MRPLPWGPGSIVVEFSPGDRRRLMADYAPSLLWRCSMSIKVSITLPLLWRYRQGCGVYTQVLGAKLLVKGKDRYLDLPIWLALNLEPGAKAAETYTIAFLWPRRILDIYGGLRKGNPIASGQNTPSTEGRSCTSGSRRPLAELHTKPGLTDRILPKHQEGHGFFDGGRGWIDNPPSSVYTNCAGR